MKTKHFLIFFAVLIALLFAWPTMRLALIEWQIQRYCQSCFGHRLQFSKMESSGEHLVVIQKPRLPLGNGSLRLQAKQARVSYESAHIFSLLSPSFQLFIDNATLTSSSISAQPYKLDLALSREGNRNVIDIHAEEVPLILLTPFLSTYLPDFTSNFLAGTVTGDLALKTSKKKVVSVTGTMSCSNPSLSLPNNLFQCDKIQFSFFPPETKQKFSSKGSFWDHLSGNVVLEGGRWIRSNSPVVDQLHASLFIKKGGFQPESEVTFTCCEGALGRITFAGFLEGKPLSLEVKANSKKLAVWLPKPFQEAFLHTLADENLRLTSAIHWKNAQLELHNQLQLENQDELVFGCLLTPQLGAEGPFVSMQEGWFCTSDLAVEKYVAPFFPYLQFQGMVNASGNFTEESASVKFDSQDLVIENSQFKLELLNGERKTEEGEYPFRYQFDFQKELYKGTLSVDAGRYLEKTSGLIFTDIKAEIVHTPGVLQGIALEAFSEGVYLAGSLELDYRRHREGIIELDIVNSTLSGEVSQTLKLLSHLDPHFFLHKIPLSGNVGYNKEGGYFHFSFLPTGVQIQALIQGTLTEGSFTPHRGGASLHDLSLNFAYDHQANNLKFFDVQGTLFSGSPGNVEEYSLKSDELQFSHLQKPEGTFDFWIGDRNRDWIRGVGKLITLEQTDQGDLIEFYFDHQRSHFGSVHPLKSKLLVQDWSHVAACHCTWEFPLETTLQDIQRLSRVGWLGFSPNLVKTVHGLKKGSGNLHVDLDYQGSDDTFTFALSGQNLAFNNTKVGLFLFNGQRQDNRWNIEQLQWDDISASMDFHQEAQDMKIDFFGLRLGELFLTGLDGIYQPQKDHLEIHLNLFEIQIPLLKRISTFQSLMQSYEPKGSLRTTGKLFIDLFKGSQGIKIAALLKASLKNFSLNEVALQDAEDIQIDFVSDKYLAISGLRTAIKGKRNTDPQIPLVIEKVDYDFLAKEWHVSGIQFQNYVQPDWLLISLRAPSKNTLGELVFSEKVPKEEKQPLKILWDYPKAELTIHKVEGTLLGSTFQLEANKEHSTESTIGLSGQINGNLYELVNKFLPSEWVAEAKNWHLNSLFQARGFFIVDRKTFDPLAFSGDLTGQDLQIRKYQFDRWSTKVEITPESIVATDLRITDSAGEFQADKIEIVKSKEDQASWWLQIPSLQATDLRPHLLHKNHKTRPEQPRSLLLRQVVVENLKGEMGSLHTFSGKGLLQFINPMRKEAKNFLFTIPEELLKRIGFEMPVLTPISGSISFEIRDNKLFMTKFKDVYADNKLLKFYLPKSNDSFIDFQGNLNIQVGIQPYHVISKLAQLWTLHIQGTLEKPNYSIAKQE